MDSGVGPVTSSQQNVLGGALRMIDLKSILDRVLQRIHAEFGNLMKQAGDEQDFVRKRLLLSYLHSTRQQLLRVLVLLQWCKKANALAECVDHGKVLDRAASHAKVLESAVHDMYIAHLERAGKCSPMWDVQTALEVLTTGAYHDLPSAIESLIPKPPKRTKEQQRKIGRVTHLIHSHLLKRTEEQQRKIGRVTHLIHSHLLKLRPVPAAPVPAVPGSTNPSTTVVGGGTTPNGQAVKAEPGSQPEIGATYKKRGGVCVVVARRLESPW
eukprot:gene493-1899_t